VKDDTEFYKQFVQNESFRRFTTGMVRELTGSYALTDHAVIREPNYDHIENG
jgi:hypothetical protein